MFISEKKMLTETVFEVVYVILNKIFEYDFIWPRLDELPGSGIWHNMGGIISIKIFEKKSFQILVIHPVVVYFRAKSSMIVLCNVEWVMRIFDELSRLTKHV